MGSNLSLAPFSSGLVGWWKFDEGSGSTLVDYSGYGNAGTWAGNSSPRYTTPKIGIWSGNLNGNDYIDVPYNSSFGFASGYIFCSWEKSSKTSAMAIGGIQNAHQFFGLNGSYIWGWARTTQKESAYSILSKINPTDGSWHYVCVVYGSQDGNIKVYTDGQLMGSQYFGGSINPDTGDATIGAQPQLGGNIFNGNLDEIRFYNRALSDYDIQTLYNSYK